MIVCPAVVGSGKRFFPDGVRLELELVEDASVKVRSFSGTPSAADRREGVERPPPTVAPAGCKQLYESVGKSLPEARSEKLMTSRKPVCS